MTSQSKNLSLVNLQWITWILLFAIHIVSLLSYDSLSQATIYSVIYIGSYLLIVYGNAGLLIPLFYERNRKVMYVISAIVLIALVILLRFLSSFYMYNTFFAEKPEPFRWTGIASSLISIILVYLSSILFYMALHYFKLKQKQEQLQKRQVESELNLLKAQVQPHFLFNTLNNIYFVAQRESPATAALLEQLSSIMRYFVEEAPKSIIPLSAELGFIKSYIELEKMRMRYPLAVTILETGKLESIVLPPQLLIPLVENVFKHGIDKRRKDNFINLTIHWQAKRLEVIVENRLVKTEEVKGVQEAGGTGIRNLSSRLDLLYGKDYILHTGQSGNYYRALLNIPCE